MPHSPPGEQLAAALLTLDLVPPLTLLEKSESFFFTSGLAQDGQVTSETRLALRTSFSNDSPHWWQSNS
jgi:hypothetical protein